MADAPAGKVMFYHLTRDPVEVTARTLLERAMGAGWRVAVRMRDADRLSWLDQKLWLGPDEGFLPHGIAGGPHDADQPILLTTDAAANTPHAVMSIDGAEASPEEAATLERLFVLFDGQDGAAVEHALGQWRRFKEAGSPAEYWSQESGKWEKKAST